MIQVDFLRYSDKRTLKKCDVKTTEEDLMLSEISQSQKDILYDYT